MGCSANNEITKKKPNISTSHYTKKRIKKIEANRKIWNEKVNSAETDGPIPYTENLPSKDTSPRRISGFKEKKKNLVNGTVINLQEPKFRTSISQTLITIHIDKVLSGSSLMNEDVSFYCEGGLIPMNDTMFDGQSSENDGRILFKKRKSNPLPVIGNKILKHSGLLLDAFLCVVVVVISWIRRSPILLKRNLGTGINYNESCYR